MKFYLVGGAVRDRLLGVEFTEKDWVVVGASPEDMLNLGYTPVGKDFPVFLHPKTKEEYALARTEKKDGHGYKGFKFNASVDVSLTEDLMRRDLTINAIAEDSSGELIDPYKGVVDIKNKVLRHVSDAFIEDPVRLLRIARFAAQLPDFNVSSDTTKVLVNIVESGELDYLTAERVWSEFLKALKQKHTEKFFAVLESCGANDVLWPNFIPDNYVYVLQSGKELEPEIKFASLFSSIPVEVCNKFISKYKIPKKFSELALLVNKYSNEYYTLKLEAKDILNLLDKVDAWRRPERVEYFLKACVINSPVDIKHQQYILDCLAYLKNINVTEIANFSSLNGKEIAHALSEIRLNKLESYLNSR
jgi:tRNA nucleotidyltransferase (CCA-adding enzyme)